MPKPTNYFRVGREVFPFVDTSTVSTEDALDCARSSQEHQAKKGPRKRLVVYQRPKVPGPWERFPIVGENFEVPS